MPEAIRETTVMMHLVFTSMASSFHTSPNSTSSLRWANMGANSPSCCLPAVCTIFSFMELPPYRFLQSSGLPSVPTGAKDTEPRL